MSTVNIRVAIEGNEEATFLTLDASDTLATLVTKLEPLVGVSSSWIQGDFILTDSGQYPPKELLLSQQESSLQKLGLWPGGSVAVSFKATSETSPAHTVASPGRSKRPLPSDVLSSHLNRFESDPILNAQPRYNVQSSSGAAQPNGAVTGSSAAVLERTANASTKTSKAGEQLRRMLMKQKAVGCRSNLDPSERFYLEFRLLASASASTAESPPAAAAEHLPAPPPASFFLYFPQNWTAGRAMDAARDLIPEWKRAPSRVPYVNRGGKSERFFVVSTDNRSTPLRQLAPNLEPFDTIDLGPEILVSTEFAAAPQTDDRHEGSKETIDCSSNSSEATAEAASATNTSSLDAHVTSVDTVSEAPTSTATAAAVYEDSSAGSTAELKPTEAAADLWTVDVQCGKSLYHIADFDPLSTTIGDLKARLLRLAFPALDDDSHGQSSSKSGVVGEKELAAGIAKLKLFIKGKKIDAPLDTQLNCSKIKSGMKLTMVLSKQ